MSTQHERRRHRRVAIASDATELSIALQSATGGSDLRTVQLRDVSASGMSFTAPKPIPVGTKISAVLSLHNRVTRVLGAVVSCRECGKDSRIVGVRFTSLNPMSGDVPAHPLGVEGQIDQLVVHR